MQWVHDPISHLISLCNAGVCIGHTDCTCVGDEKLVSNSKCKKKVIKVKKKDKKGKKGKKK